MSEGSGEPGREPDPWSRPADFGEPGSTAPAPGDQPTAPPDPWSAPSPAASGEAGQPGSPGGTAQQPPATPNGFSPGGADPWAAPAGGQYPPAGQYPPGQYPPGQYPPPGQYGYQRSPYYPPGAVPRNNPLAIAALVCGIAQFLLGLVLVGNILLAIPAVICGALGIRQINQRGERGRGMAIAGLVLGILGIVYFVIIVLVIIIGVSVRSH
ncbi:MAG TPA: DUF4190 domain-containing protein [Streptosporangiaceae bacterium]|nr:DUF4190 domain-containing protein [Streptosporangiaceae bacterium]